MPTRYRSPDEDSARWLDFAFRAGDIVISTRSKSGTTWMQMICALLVFQTPELPAPLPVLSPWLDWLITPRDEVYAALAAQGHRRFIKTHTPLDGLPLDPRVTYVVVARHPLDLAVSLYHQGANLDRDRLRELIGRPQPAATAPERVPLHDWLTAWIGRDVEPVEALDSLPGVLWHLSDAWARRHDDNVLLVRFADLLDDLAGQMRQIADRLAITVPGPAWSALVDAATFEQMRIRAADVVPDPAGVLKDRTAFFRTGRAGLWQAVLTDAEHRRYAARAATLAPPDLLAWLHGSHPGRA